MANISFEFCGIKYKSIEMTNRNVKIHKEFCFERRGVDYVVLDTADCVIQIPREIIDKVIIHYSYDKNQKL
jgi:hypothetical protein